MRTLRQNNYKYGSEVVSPTCSLQENLKNLRAKGYDIQKHQTRKLREVRSVPYLKKVKPGLEKWRSNVHKQETQLKVEPPPNTAYTHIEVDEAESPQI